MVRRWLKIGAFLAAALLSRGARAQSTDVLLVTTPMSIYDDATLLDPGEISVDLSTSFSRTQSGYYLSAPGLDFALGLNRRLEVSSASGFALAKSGQDRTYGLDDNYFGLKVLLVPKGEHRPAIAIKPTLEILNTSGIDPSLNPHGVSFVLPLLVEKEFDDWAVSYTGGYVTRGLAFSTVKLEGDWWEHFTPVLTLSYSQFTVGESALSAQGLNRRQTDASAGFQRDINSHWSVFAEVGRTIGRIDPASTSFECTAGITFTASLWREETGKSSRRFPIHF